LICTICNKEICNTPGLISQHKKTATHIKNLIRAEGEGNVIASIVADVDENVFNETIQQNHHNNKRASTKVVRIWMCQACGLTVPADPTSVTSHTKSAEHQRQVAWDAEPDTRDGKKLAAATRQQNESAQSGMRWISINKRDGTKINKLVKFQDKSDHGTMCFLLL
jgi:hypothetical protein